LGCPIKQPALVIISQLKRKVGFNVESMADLLFDLDGTWIQRLFRWQTGKPSHHFTCNSTSFSLPFFGRPLHMLENLPVILQ
jgi:hypothetical protein